jgi:hypothetical protein
MCNFDPGGLDPRMRYVLELRGQDIVFVLLVALAALSFTVVQTDMEECRRMGSLLTPWLTRFMDFSHERKLGKTHEYMFVSLCLADQNVVPAVLFTLMPEIRAIPFGETDPRPARRLLRLLVGKNMKRVDKLWGQVSIDVVQVWIQGMYTAVRAGTQVSDMILKPEHLNPILAALTAVADQELQDMVLQRITGILEADVILPLSTFCSSFVYAVTHIVYVLGSYIHGVCIYEEYREVYIAVHRLLAALADQFGRMSPTHWALHAECAIEVTIALHMLSVDPNNVTNAGFTVPPCCAATRTYIRSYSSDGDLSLLAQSRFTLEKRCRRKAMKDNKVGYLYDEIHTRMVVVHALALFARFRVDPSAPAPSPPKFTQDVTYNERTFSAVYLNMALAYMRDCPPHAKLTGETITLALPGRKDLSFLSMRSFVTHMLTYMCDECHLVTRERAAGMCSPYTYCLQ